MFSNVFFFFCKFSSAALMNCIKVAAAKSKRKSWCYRLGRSALAFYINERHMSSSKLQRRSSLLVILFTLTLSLKSSYRLGKS